MARGTQNALQNGRRGLHISQYFSRARRLTLSRPTSEFYGGKGRFFREVDHIMDTESRAHRGPNHTSCAVDWWPALEQNPELERILGLDQTDGGSRDMAGFG